MQDSRKVGIVALRLCYLFLLSDMLWLMGRSANLSLAILARTVTASKPITL